VNEVAKDLRSFINFLEEKGDLIRIEKEVSTRFEASAIMKKMDSGPALFFEKIKESKMQMVAGICGSKSRLCEALGTTEDKIYNIILNSIRAPTKPKFVDDGPVKEVIEEPKLSRFPILIHYEKDAGPYITSALVSAKSVDGKIENVSIHRLQVLDENHLAIRIVPRHLYRLCQMAKEKGKNLEVAISIGVHPALSLAASCPAPFGVSEFYVANSMLGGALKLLRCEHVNANVPADAEIVFEGRLLLDREVLEGPFVDLTGTYDIARKQPVIELVKTMRRKNCIYQALLPAGSEHRILMGLPREAKIWEIAHYTVPTVKAVNLTVGGGGWLHAIISIEKQSEGDAKNVALAAFAAHPSLKHVVVVDSDIDIYDLNMVEWAIATRFRGDRGLIVLPNIRGSSLDPSGDQETELVTKVGVDATMTFTKSKEKFEMAKIPGERETVKRIFPQH
jgi:UbiD family decarboxylase